LAVILFLPISQALCADSHLKNGGSFFESTYFIELTQDTTASLKARDLRNGGFETSEGAYVDFARWYSPDWYDTRISWLTQISPSFGVIWGFSTGENAQKYTISPGMRLGFMYQTTPSKNSQLTFTASTTIGGELSEKTCTADYGQIGGVQVVNCRLAATTLTPEETLNYLTQAKPVDTWQIRYTLNF
jgi:hypothetical protein